MKQPSMCRAALLLAAAVGLAAGGCKGDSGSAPANADPAAAPEKVAASEDNAGEAAAQQGEQAEQGEAGEAKRGEVVAAASSEPAAGELVPPKPRANPRKGHDQAHKGNAHKGHAHGKGRHAHGRQPPPMGADAFKDFSGKKLALIHTANRIGEFDPCG